MSGPEALSIAYLEKRPLSAARALAAIDPADAAALLETIPSRFTALAFRHMDPWAASAVSAQMSRVGAAGLFRELDYPDAVAILRLLPDDVQSEILEALPQDLRRDMRTTLTYPEDTVGAHMSTAIMSLTAGDTVAEAKSLIRRSPATAGDSILILDKSGRLAGAVKADTLLRRSGPTVLGEVMDETGFSVSARARLAAIADHEIWDVSAYVPVTDHKKQVIGVLSREALRKAFEREHSGDARRQASITISMAEAFFYSAYGLAQLLADFKSVPDRTPAQGE